MYNRYVDDTANGTKALAPGLRWGEEEKSMVYLPHLVEEASTFVQDFESQTTGVSTLREVLPSKANSSSL